MAALTRDVVTRFLADTSQMKQATQQVAQNTQSIGKSFSSMASSARFGIAAIAGSGVISAIGSTITAATNLGESVNAVNVVFGNSAGKIHQWAESAADSAGLAHSAANQLIVPIGSMLQNVGISSDEAAEKSINLAQRAADMASVFNVDVSEALGAIQAGLRGEADPLERFGVGLSAAAVEAKILEEGIRGSKNEITAADKVMGRYLLLMEQTEKLSGDFANTSDSLANRQRILNAELENTKAKFGELLVPAINQVVSSGGDLLTVLTKLIELIPGAGEAAEETAKKGFRHWGEVLLWLNSGGLISLAADTIKASEAQEGLTESALEASDAHLHDLKPAIEEVTASIYEQIDAFLAASNPTFAAFQAIQKLTKAEEAYTRALAEHGPKSDEAVAAAGELTEAKLRASAASQVFAEEGGAAAIEAFRLAAINAGIAKDSIDAYIASVLTANQTPVPKVPFTSGGGGGGGTYAFHEGGVVPGPRGREQWALVKGGETILPTHKGAIAFSGSGSGGPSITMNVSTLDPNVIALKVREAMEWARRGG